MAIKIIYPIKGKVVISFKFGEAPKWYTNIFGCPHDGIDFACQVGTPVVATDDGIISFCDDIADTNGKGIIINHSWGQSVYWHLNSLSATLSQKVKKGDVIGYSGATGIVTGPHLHFAIRLYKNGHNGSTNKVDPMQYIQDSNEIIANPIVEQKYYTVKFLDSLWKIAKKVYGDPTRWHEIYMKNNGLIKDPNKLKIGWRLII